ncbi:hypothetical protein C5167_030886 [Papaver somniferum]|uniref:short-chain dehydrogenase reductase 3b-like n=1 Tax=Papaver somniferum TaxID=3469 RepID=UPI000E7053CB|nr:short-chain dehydrogenase reductase 3b-like [Papaver somniferum]RZC89188.1 hypothetical protein C5167_030886 [Papaver somniferum]
MSKLRLEGKVAIITGAASGIGEATARLFVEHGAFVVVADIQDELGDQVVSSIGKEKASYKHCDVSVEKQVEETVAFALEKYGSLDIVYSNAGMGGSFSSILDFSLEDFNKIIATNVSGAALMIKHAARAMLDRKIRGSIICTASVAAVQAGFAPHCYTASKHAVLGLVQSACSELGAYGIRVNCISPSGVGTPLACDIGKISARHVEEYTAKMSLLKGIILKAKHIADAALFLASDDSVYLNGHNLVVDGGFTVAASSFPINVSSATS